MIETGADVELIDPDLVICTLDDGASIRIELVVENGKGYVPASVNRREDAPIGVIPVDAIYSPVRQVSYKVENTRVGQVTDFDKLSLRIETNGAMGPEDAVAYRSEEPTSELQSLMRISYAVFCWKKKKNN